MTLRLLNMEDFPDAPEDGRLAHGHRWGPWILDAERLCLCACPADVTDPTENFYEVDLERVGSPSDLMDWLEQLAEKTWVKREPSVLGHLTCALISLFHPRDWMRDGKRVDPVDLLMRSIDRKWP